MFELLLADFRSTGKSFSKILIGGVLFALVGHLMFVLPYLAYKEQEERTTASLLQQEREHRKIKHQVAAIQQSVKTLERLLDDVEREVRHYPDHLRAVLREIEITLASRRAASRKRSNLLGSDPHAVRQREPAPQLQQAPPRTEPRTVMKFSLPPHITTFEPAVRWYIEQWFTDLLQRIVRDLHPIFETWKTVLGETTSLEMDTLTEDAVKKIHDYLQSIDPAFWQSYQHGKVPVARQLVTVIHEALAPLRTEFSQILDRRTVQLARQRQTMEDLRRSMKEAQRQVQQLAAKIQAIESPFGPIPLGIHTFVFAFPVLVMAFVIAAGWMFNRSLHLHRVLIAEFQRTYPEYSEDRLRLIANDWYLPPYPSPLIPLVLCVAGGLMVGIAFWAGMTILSAPESVMQVGFLGTQQRVFLTVAYGLAALSMMWVVLQAYRNVGEANEPVPASPRIQPQPEPPDVKKKECRVTNQERG